VFKKVQIFNNWSPNINPEILRILATIYVGYILQYKARFGIK